MTAVGHDVDPSRIGLIVGGALAMILAIVVVAHRVGPIATGTLIALVVAVVATRYALQANRETRL